jgi:hypothetical protein
MTISLPARVFRPDEAHRAHGDLIDRLAPWFYRTDPLADEAVAALERDRAWASVRQALRHGIDQVPQAPGPLRALFASLDEVPIWVDRARADRAGRILFRAGTFGAIVLGARSLLAGYCSPAGNKPLVWVGRMGGPGQSQRLAETSRFVTAVCAPRGLQRQGEGFTLCVHVRLMHAKVRYLIGQTGRWQPELWGAPINQHDMMATSLLFSQYFIDGLRLFGLHVAPEEALDWLHLWRWASTLLGVETSLLPVTEAEARGLLDLIERTQGLPDEDSRKLAKAMLAGVPVRFAGGEQLVEGLCRALLGDRLADGLQLGRTPLRHTVRATSLVVRPLDRLRARSRTVERWLVRVGQRSWDEAIERSRTDALAFRPPESLTEPASR